MYYLWTDEEIKKLKEFYLSGMPIKCIARKINRTPTSVNKALSRFGIRISKNKNSLPIPVHKYADDKQKNKRGFQEKRSFFVKRFQEEWVTLESVKRYLQRIGFNIKENTYNGLKKIYCNNKILSPLQLILLANRHRLENNLSCFKVNEITW